VEIILDSPLSTVRFSFFYRRFLDEHHRDLVANGIDEAAVGIDTFEARLGGVDLNLGSALRTTQYL
jgi:hypothetical protein